MHHPPLNNRAFTLLELIVVMVLIALTASFTVPQISNFLYTDQLKATVRKLEGLISQSSQLAQRRQVPYLLKYIINERRFIVEPVLPEAEKDERANKEGELHLAETVTVKDFWTWYGGIRPPEELLIQFSKSGYVEPTVIHLQEEGGQEISVVLSPFLGKIQVVDSYVVPNKDTPFQ